MLFVVYLSIRFKIKTVKIISITILFFLLVFDFANSQTIQNNVIREKIDIFKKDVKGPYQQIMWFCADGSKVPPRMRCPEPGGVQRATYKSWIEELAKSNHIFLGQILATTDFFDFLDEKKPIFQIETVPNRKLSGEH